MNLEEKLVAGKELTGIKRKRGQKYIFEKFEPELQTKRENEGWQFDKRLKEKVKMKKEKPIDEQFEDEVWILFASMGFDRMNKDRNLKFPYSADNNELTKQIDVFAVDEETILFIECKCALKGKKSSFKDEIEAIGGIRQGLISEARKRYPDRKVKYIFATKNYELSEIDRERMKQFEITHFDEYSIKYYVELTKHLGSSARFQLLGYLFDGQKIGAMENKIPAIQGKMGGHTYYSFSIEPEKLLKIAYVLHRNEANKDLMPTYQRLIKKNRLKEIQKFIDGGGFFPNSLIISIDTKKAKLNFDLAAPQEASAISKIGILHLPQKYRSVHIIDGQHRLYGYADSLYVENNTIPVVAFVDLDQKKQVELFMEINENQKSVSKNLQNTLNADLLWESDDWNKRRKALRLHIAQKLGETQASPFFGRITLGENEASQTCCIKIETIENALRATKFLSKYSKGNAIVDNGTFDKGNNPATQKILYPFIYKCFEYFKDNCPEEWEKGDHDLGVLSINNTVHGIIRILNDVIEYLIEHKNIDPKNESLDILMTDVEYYLAPLANYFNSINEQQRREIRTHYGSGGKVQVWRTFQKIIRESRKEFNPDGLEQWIRDNSNQYNAESMMMCQDLEVYIKKNFKEKLQKKYNEKWETAGIPAKVYKQANDLMGKKNYEYSVNNENIRVELWDCVSLLNCKAIATFGSNWSELFESEYTRPNEKKIAGGKSAKVEWLDRLYKIKNRIQNESISEGDFLFLQDLRKWLLAPAD